MYHNKPGGARERAGSKRPARAGQLGTTKPPLIHGETNTLLSASSSAVAEDTSVQESWTEERDEISSTRSRNVRPHHSQFKSLVLDPCCIQIDEKRTIIPSAWAHFRTSRPEGPYEQLPRLQEANV